MLFDKIYMVKTIFHVMVWKFFLSNQKYELEEGGDGRMNMFGKFDEKYIMMGKIPVQFSPSHLLRLIQILVKLNQFEVV